MGIAPQLGGQPWGKASVALAQLDPGLIRQAHQQGPGALVKLGVSPMGNVLFHDSVIDRDPFEALVTDRARGPARLNGLG